MYTYLQGEQFAAWTITGCGENGAGDNERSSKEFGRNFSGNEKYTKFQNSFRNVTLT